MAIDNPSMVRSIWKRTFGRMMSGLGVRETESLINYHYLLLLMVTKSEYAHQYYLRHKEELLAKNKAWREANPDKMKASKDAWNSANKEEIAAYSKNYRKENNERVKKWKNDWYHNNPEKGKEMHRRHYFKRNYGLTPEDYERMKQERNNKCDICGNICDKRRKDGLPLEPCIDHDHNTKKIRGMLCNRCNQTLGRIEDDPDLLLKMIDYLRRTRGSGN
jgi:hypothetical protein